VTIFFTFGLTSGSLLFDLEMPQAWRSRT